MDRLYTNFEKCADWLLGKKITSVGTIQQNRVGIPPEMRDIKDRDLLSYELYWRDDGKCNLSSYVVKTNKGKRNVMVLSTVEPLLGVTKDENKKPAIMKFYDFTKGGTDIIDQKMGTYTTKITSNRWTLTAFCYLLDKIRVYSCTLCALANNKDPKSVNSFDYGTEMALVRPYVDIRPMNGLQSSIQNKIELYTGTKKVTHAVRHLDEYEKTSPTPKRCRICIDDSKGNGQKQSKDKMKKINSLCQKCGQNVCKTHVLRVCSSCNGK